jgi:hypothetical protein
VFVAILTNPPRWSHVSAASFFYTDDENQNQTSTKEVEMSTNSTVANQWIKRLPFAVILLAAVLTLSLIFANHQPVVRFGLSAPVNESAAQRAINADAARYTAMAEAYLAREAAALRGINADAARYTGLNDPFVPQSLDLLVSHSQRGVNFLVVLTQQRGRGERVLVGVRQFDGVAGHLRRTSERMLHLHHHVAEEHLFVAQRLGDVVDRRAGDAGRLQFIQPVFPGVRREDLVQPPVDESPCSSSARAGICSPQCPDRRRESPVTIVPRIHP